ncbi:hypothetical protein SI65_00894 [Aspergillus cristatus]|uniref:mRNA-capping enzyme subunit beta n=1 Tax=Aspergillus cristatus TaxID=573508 RepID=A0A1E3BQS5_ASPCR|nr:hypothetical protein SI65_00894 [Aspergillus cristatus]
MDLRSIINTESASNSDSSSSENRPPAHERPSFAAPAPPATPYAPSSRESFAAPAPYNHPQPHPQPVELLSSPYTPHSASAGAQQHSPQQSFAPKRSQSIQSVLSSDPAPSYPYHAKDHSPVAAPQPLPSQQFSPRAQGSLPGTPLGPPPAFARSSPSVRPQSSGHESQPGQPPSSWVGQDSAHSHDQKPLVSPSAQSRPSWQDSKLVEQTPRHHSAASEKEHEETVSPRTVGTPRTRQGSSIGPADQAAASSARSHSHSEEQGWKQSPTRSLSHSSQQQPQQYQQTPVDLEDKAQSLPSQMDTTPDVTASPSSQPPRHKRRRFNEPPIYAQRSRHARGTGPVIKNPLPPVPKHMRNSPSNPWSARARSSAASVSGSSVRASSQGPLKVHADEPAPANGPPVQAAPAAPAVPVAPLAPAPPQPQPGSLGAWEPSVTGYIPHEDMTKLVCDFLFQHVVLRNDVGAGPAGSSATGQGAIIEVEAKLGKHIDQDRRERLYLPVMTETILNRENSRFRTSFESSMSLAQHRAMNNFLNDIVKAAMPNSNPGRIPLSYAHKKERDTFYEVPPSELPPLIRQNLNPRHKPRVRVTTDQRTGEILAKIVKIRIADLNVFSPRTCVDYRISVNLEMNYDGDVSHLPVVDTNSDGGKARDRNKDRMSYRHLAYQVDLTQVAKSESAKNEFDHELEVEISAAEIRRQGQLAMAGDPKNQYEDLVKGFLDNIRVLARAVPPQ